MEAETEPDKKEILKTQYITLAEFISDDIAERVNVIWQSVADTNCEPGEESKIPTDSEGMDEVIQIQKGIADHGAKLLQEISGLLG